MSENQHIEDLDVESDGADAIVGGKMGRMRAEEEKLLKEGWVAKACTEDGGTLMENRHTHAKRVLHP